MGSSRDPYRVHRGPNRTLGLRRGGRFSPWVLVSVCEEQMALFDIPVLILRVRAARVRGGRRSKGILEQERALPFEVDGLDKAGDLRELQFWTN